MTNDAACQTSTLKLQDYGFVKKFIHNIRPHKRAAHQWGALLFILISFEPVPVISQQ